MTILTNKTIWIFAIACIVPLTQVAAQCPYSHKAKAEHVASKCASDRHTASKPMIANKKDIVDTAVAAGKFKTLAAALTAADLVETLKGEGPFTVFAPTDAAFKKLPAGTVETLLKPENKAKLASILTYHVVPGEVYASDVVKLKKAKTVQGSKAPIEIRDGKVYVAGAQVTTTDIKTKNGVIHIIDSVMLPK
mgnify:CR=1 FL=1